MTGRASPTKPVEDPSDPFSSLSLLDRPNTNDSRPPPPTRSETQPTPSHRPTRSIDEAKRRGEGGRGPPRPRGPPAGHKVIGSPERSARRQRRNSESSFMEKTSLTDEEKKRRERRRRERDSKGKDGRSRDPRTRRPKGYDIIDKLDVTGIYGPGQFHHDGPFDACNPHRNRKKDGRAPMQAFPKDSANNALGGAGPLNKNIDLDQFHGRGTEGFTDYATSGNVQPPIVRRDRNGNYWNPKGTLEPVHGEESHGLGTSTFLEGAPASKTDMQRRDSENDQTMVMGAGAGLQRKKSLAQRIRGISQPRRDFGPVGPASAGGRITSPGVRSPVDGANLEGGPLSAGGHTRTNENPFFDDYDDAYDRKGANIKSSATATETEREPESAGGMSRARAPSSPYRTNGLERRVTNDDGADKQGGGFINRMKSLRGGRRPRPERRDV